MTGEVNSIYNYYDAGVPEKKINYSYSTFFGEQFIDAWRSTRKSIYSNYRGETLENLSIEKLFEILEVDPETIGTLSIIKDWYFGDMSIFYPDINLLLKRFEVVKKIYDEYDGNFRPLNKTKFNNFNCYLTFGHLLVTCFEQTKKLQYLNSLLKLNDILCSLKQRLSNEEKEVLTFLVRKEERFVNDLIKETR